MAKTNLKPLMGYVLVESMDEEELTASGLALPEKAKEKPSKGRVVAIGAPIIHYEVFGEMETCSVGPGDIVIHHKWAGQDVKEGQKEYRLVKFADLMAVYE